MKEEGDGEGDEGNDEAYQQFLAKMNKGQKQYQQKKKKKKTPEDSDDGEEDYDNVNDDMNIETTNTNVDPIPILQDMGLLNGRDHKSLKFREPSDIQQRAQRVSKKIKKKPDHPIGPLNVIPRRENQNEYTLQACNKRKGEFPPLQEEITERTLANPDYKEDIFPIEDMLLRGFMPFYSYNIKEIICAASNELHRASIIINNKNATLAASTVSGDTVSTKQLTTVTKKRKTKHGDVSTATGEQETTQYDDNQPHNEAMTVKPASQFGWDIPNYGSNSTTGKAELFEKVRLYYADCKERMGQFFIDDQLEVVNGGVTPQHRPPRSFAIYNELEQQFRVRYQERLSVLKESASRVPKFDDEPPIPKQWIDSYRLRPLSTDELCSRGTSCCFNVYVKKDNMRYIGRVFETPREVKEKPTYVRNKQRFCIDCLLDSWTDGTYEVVAGESVPLMQRNYFTVLCESGQYNENCMLPTMMNNKPTGITGHVPAYNKNKRISIPIKIQQIEGSHFYHISTNYLAETGMDFQ